MQEAETLRQQWLAAEREYGKGITDGKPAAELQAVLGRARQLKEAYFAKARLAIELGGSRK
jgi:hypothetical protein